jgi:hypothetical protein
MATFVDNQVDNNIDENDVPGTVLLIDADFSLNRRHSKKQTDVVLVPTPSADPEDPLNWSSRRKLLATTCMVM